MNRASLHIASPVASHSSTFCFFSSLHNWKCIWKTIQQIKFAYVPKRKKSPPIFCRRWFFVSYL